MLSLMRKRTIEDYRNLESRTGYTYVGGEIPPTTHTDGSWTCPDKHLVSTSFHKLNRRGRACSRCVGKNKTVQDYEELGARRGYVLREKTVPKNNKTPVWWDCIKASHPLRACWNYLHQKNRKECAKCTGASTERKVFGDYLALEAETGYRLMQDQPPANTHTKTGWWCIDSHPTYASFHTLKQNGFCCSNCHSVVSEPERAVLDLVVREFLPDAISQARVLPNQKMSFDVYSPLKKIAIEVDGDYWHSLPGIANRDSRKDIAAKAAGILVIRIPVTYRVTKSGKARQCFEKEVRSLLTSSGLRAIV